MQPSQTAMPYMPGTNSMVPVIHDSKHVRRVGNVTLNHMISVCRAQTQFREGIAGANKNKADCHPSPMW